MGSSPIFPSIKNTTYPYSYISNYYNLLVSKKKSYIYVKYTKKNLKIIKLIYRIGVISNFFLNKHFLIKITPFFYKNSPFFKKIHNVSTPSKTFFLNTKTIRLVNIFWKSSILILSTRKGLLTSKEALKLGLGGKVIYIIK